MASTNLVAGALAPLVAVVAELEVRLMEKASKQPMLAQVAVEVEGEIRGRTIITRAAPETSDDEGPDFNKASSHGPAIGEPFLARLATETPGSVRGGTRITESRETTDD